MVAAGDAVKVEGLREFNRALRQIDTGLPKALRLALNEAADVVVADARGRVPSRSGRARGSIRAQSTRTQARVSAGGGRAQYYPWLDFGGQIGRASGRARGRRGQRRYIADGRYLYAAYYQRRDSGEVQRTLESSLGDLIKSAGLEVT